MGTDLRYVLRRALASPAPMLAASAMLAVAIGLATAMFAIVDALLVRPVPFAGADRMAQVYMGNDRGGSSLVPPAVFEAWRSSPVFDMVQGVALTQPLVDTPRGLESIAGASVDPTVFASLEVTPIRGRVFDVSEAVPGNDDRVVISEELWRRSFASDPTVVGKHVRIDGQLMEVIGILPASFRFPAWNTMVWRPVDFQRATAREFWPRAYVRYAPGVPEDDALKTATTLAHGVDPAQRDLRAITWAVVDAVPYYERAMPLLSGSVALVFLVLCANVASLLLVRLTARGTEFSVAAALGASRGRLVRQAFLETGLIGLLGIVAGVCLAWLVVSLTRNWLPDALLIRTLNPISLDARALVAASAAGLVATLAAGVIPAWLGTRANAGAALTASSRGNTASSATKAATRAFLVVEVAFAFTLLIGAALLGRSFVNLATADRGLDTSGVTTVWLSMPAATFGDRPARVTTAGAIEDALRGFPEVLQIAASNGLPPGGGATHYASDLQSDAEGAASLTMALKSYSVGPDFYDLYRVPVLSGRSFLPGDADTDVIIGERLASTLWPGQVPIGRSYRMLKTWYRVVGVARETHLPSLDDRLDLPEFYRPFVPGPVQLSLNIRCTGACPSEALLTQRIMTVHPALQVHRVQRLDDVYAEQTGRPRAVAAVSGTLAAIALVAAAAGFFGVLSYAAGLRRREFGIRAALGASRSSLWTLVFADGLRVVCVGMAFGMMSAWWLARATAALHYGVTATDPWTWLVVGTVVLAATVAAVWHPAREAGRADPTMLLKSE